MNSGRRYKEMLVINCIDKNYSSPMKGEKMQENKTGTRTIKKIGKASYEVVIHFNENASETMQDKLKRIILREMERGKIK